MSFTGTIKNGVITLPPGVTWADGTEVELTPLIPAVEAERFTDELLSIARRTKKLPPDLAKNHDHYLHGFPRK